MNSNAIRDGSTLTRRVTRQEIATKHTNLRAKRHHTLGVLPHLNSEHIADRCALKK
ncbi:hypothetical protein ACFOGG_17645 [Brenneria rubrifaciens]|uniref:hypothetical protein n=1 Tax=Brenneria rubrifaciens TaxID=55213 RepID=UPI003616CC52